MTPRHRVPPPATRLSAKQRETWLELAAAVEHLGAYAGAADLPAFRVLARSVALADSAEAAKMPPTALVRLLQTAATQLASWGLTPGSRAKVRHTQARAGYLRALSAFAAPVRETE